MTPETISVDVKLTFWELYRITAYLIFRTFRIFLIPAALLLLLFLLFLCYIALNPSPENTFSRLIESFGATPYVLLGLLFFFFGMPLLAAWKSYPSPPVRVGTRSLLSANGVWVDTDLAQCNLTLAAFKRA